mmetsp:Transcript_64167/g.150602  ORF Transcript_64167/g.150602 Transcript_64167/m.150602 type:complete len:490 (-) Transcript_64167:17-1486(-)
MAIDLLANVDDDDDGDWGICWDFERDDWGSGWKSSGSWNRGWQSAQAPRASKGESPFAGDAMASPVAPWWARPSSQAGWGGTPGDACSPDLPFRGDSDVIRPLYGLTPLAGRHGGMVRIPPPPPPPPGVDQIQPQIPSFAIPPVAEVADALPLRDPLQMEKGPKETSEAKKKKKKKEPRERERLDGGSKEVREEISVQIESVVSLPGSNLQKADFDSGVRRYLGALRGCQNGQQKTKDAMAMLHHYTSQKTRSAVKNWPAYLLTLLKRFEPGVLAKGGGKGDRSDEKRPPSAAEAAASGLPQRSLGAPITRPVAAATKDVEKPQAKVAETAAVPEVLPTNWKEGRQPLLQEVSHALATDIIRSPFTGEALDLQEALVAPVAEVLSVDRRLATEPASLLSRHVRGLAASRDLLDCSRALAAADHAQVAEVTTLPEDASSLQGADVMRRVSQQRGGNAEAVARIVFEEIGLELLAESLRNPDVSTNIIPGG